MEIAVFHYTGLTLGIDASIQEFSTSHLNFFVCLHLHRNLIYLLRDHDYYLNDG